jgi:hypothetical protein
VLHYIHTYIVIRLIIIKLIIIRTQEFDFLAIMKIVITAVITAVTV